MFYLFVALIDGNIERFISQDEKLAEISHAHMKKLGYTVSQVYRTECNLSNHGNSRILRTIFSQLKKEMK